MQSSDAGGSDAYVMKQRRCCWRRRNLRSNCVPSPLGLRYSSIYGVIGTMNHSLHIYIDPFVHLTNVSIHSSTRNICLSTENAIILTFDGSVSKGFGCTRTAGVRPRVNVACCREYFLLTVVLYPFKFPLITYSGLQRVAAQPLCVMTTLTAVCRPFRCAAPLPAPGHMSSSCSPLLLLLLSTRKLEIIRNAGFLSSEL
ncbi:hypothetical protein J6590_050067 [Homalodisca vitripennis]|nr:hypothetical protein J6590_050067 [Homalodisca vitripennis]